MIEPEAERRWTEYLVAERDRIRHVMMPALDRFLDALLALTPEIWQRWAKDLARDVADDGADLPVRFPLFRRAVLPALERGVIDREPGCARWLSHFEQLMFHPLPESMLPANLRGAEGLLEEALRVDPEDDRARRLLIKRRGSYLVYTLHELPSGVLYGHNGATPEECDELLALLADFRTHVTRLGESAEYSELVADCNFHFRAYRDYLRADRPGGSYEGYLRTHSPYKPDGER
jgi:hypothetical protein